MRPDDLVLAVDLGTSEAKVAAMTLRGELVARAAAPLELMLVEGGGAEQDPREWWRAITQASREVVGRLEPGQAVGAVCCTGQWGGTVAVDEAHEPLGNAMIWLDSRGRPQVQRIVGGFPSIDGYSLYRLFHWARLTAGVPQASGKDPVAHILHIKEEDPERYARCHRFLEPKDYLNLVMTGRARTAPDAIAIHWVTDNRDLAAVDYHPRLLRWAGLDRAKLPDLGRSTDVVGPLLPERAAELGVPEGIPVVAGTPDIHAAALGSGASRDFSAHLSVGTSAWVTCHVPFKRSDYRHSLVTLPSANPDRYLVIAEQETAGAALRHFAEEILFAKDALGSPEAPEDLYDRLGSLAAEAPPGADGLVFLPWLYGERCPVEDSSIRGGFHNMSLRTTRAHMVRAVMEGVACNARWLLDPVERFVGRSFPELRVIGGGSRSELWCQVLADVLDRPVLQVPDPSEACARGAALLAAVGLGHATFEELEDMVEPTRRFQPDPTNRAVYDRLYEAFVGSYRALAPLHRRLNDRS
jgi:xylulokinase